MWDFLGVFRLKQCNKNNETAIDVLLILLSHSQMMHFELFVMLRKFKRTNKKNIIKEEEEEEEGNVIKSVDCYLLYIHICFFN